MPSFSWSQWLRTACEMIGPNKRRPAKRSQSKQIEGLEERTLLTAPVAVDDSGYTVDEDAALNGTSVLANDTDVDNDIAGAVLDSNPAHALNFSFNPADGTFTYTPAANFHGTDTFTYHAVDGTPADSNIATVTITVGQVNDAGVFGGNTSGTGAEDTNITGTLTFADSIDGFTTPNFAVSIPATNGTASIDPSTGAWSYSPNPNYNGADSFTVSVTDDDGNVETQVITLGVTQVNDAGAFGGNINGSGAEDTNITGTLTFADAADGFTTPNFAVSVPASNGAATIDPTTGAWSYSPNANYNGPDSFTVSVTDDDGNVETQVITLGVTQVNDTGTFGGNMSGAAQEDNNITGTLTFNDANDGFTTPDFSVSVAALHGTANIDATTGAWTYSPAANYNGFDSFTVSVTDDDGNVETQVVNLTINAVNDAPVANNQSVTTSKNLTLQGTLTGSDVEGSNLTFAAGATNTAHGTVTINPNGTFSYTPAANYTGADSFTFMVNDGTANSTEATVSITVADNVAPVATPDSFTTNEDTPHTGTLAATDADSDTLTFFAGLVAPSHGSVVINPNGSYTYTPTANFHGSDSFSFYANDGTANSGEATITVTVTSVNDVPVANAAAFTAGKNSPLQQTLTGSDADGDTLTFAIGTVAAAHGTVAINANGTFTYTPANNYTGPDSFSFKVSDGASNSTEATVTLNVVDNTLPTADATSFTTGEDAPHSGTLTGADADLDPITFHVGVAPAHGTVVINPDGTYTYTPAANSHGADAFTFFTSDAFGNSQEALVMVKITSTDDAPSVTGATLTVQKNTNLQGTLTGTDADGDSIVFAAGAVSPAHGTVVIHPDGTFTYTPATDYFGPDSFSFTATDGTLTSTEATIAITVSNNSLPVATAGSFTTNEDTAHNGTLAATDANSDPLTFHQGTVTAAHGTVTINPDGSFVYTPAANYNGSDSFSFFANDGTGDGPEATITITVTSVNDTPVANTASFTTNEDTVLNNTLTATDVDTGSLTFSAGSTTPAHGTVTVNANGTFTYTPAANFHGTDTFSFKASDGTTTSTDALVTVTVTSVNDVPVVTNGTASVNQNAVLNGSVSTLGTDGDADPLTYVAVAQPTHGTLTLSPDGTYVYTPAAGYTGADSFTFKANDGQADSNVGTVNLTVVDVDDPLTLTLPGGDVTVNRNSQKVQLDGAASVADPDTTINYSNAQITVSVVSGNSADDNKNNRFSLSVLSQGTGNGLLKVKGSKIYFSNSVSPIATFTGGTKGQNLLITFTGAATQDAVNAVLKQLSAQASKKASTGPRVLDIKITAQGQMDHKTKTVNVV